MRTRTTELYTYGHTLSLHAGFPIGPDHGELPVHPTLGVGPRPRVRRAEPAEAVAGGEIAHDAVRFPQHEPVLVHGRNEAVRVHGEVFGRAVAAERTAHVDTLERQPELGARPEDLDRKSTRLNPVTNAHLVCRLLLENKKHK